jgi:hypothetical protein
MPPRAVVLLHDHASRLKLAEEVAHDGVVDLPRLKKVEEQNAYRSATPAVFDHVSLENEVRNSEAGDGS